MKKLRKKEVKENDSVMTYASCDASCPSCAGSGNCGQAGPYFESIRVSDDNTNRIKAIQGVYNYYN